MRAPTHSHQAAALGAALLLALAPAAFADELPAADAEVSTLPRYWHLSAQLAGFFLQTPTPSLGPSLQAVWKVKRLGLGVQLLATIPFPSGLGEGAVWAHTVTAGPVVCFHADVFGVCAAGSFGFLHGGASNLPGARADFSAVAAVGPLLFAQVPLSGTTRLRFQLAAEVPLVRTVLDVGATAAWSQPSISLSLAVGLTFRTPG